MFSCCAKINNCSGPTGGGGGIKIPSTSWKHPLRAEKQDPAQLKFSKLATGTGQTFLETIREGKRPPTNVLTDKPTYRPTHRPTNQPNDRPTHTDWPAKRRTRVDRKVPVPLGSIHKEKYRSNLSIHKLWLIFREGKCSQFLILDTFSFCPLLYCLISCPLNLKSGCPRSIAMSNMICIWNFLTNKSISVLKQLKFR